jgi:hypothetical protein
MFVELREKRWLLRSPFPYEVVAIDDILVHNEPAPVVEVLVGVVVDIYVWW